MIYSCFSSSGRVRYGGVIHPVRDLSIWLDEQQVNKKISYSKATIYSVCDGLLRSRGLDMLFDETQKKTSD